LNATAVLATRLSEAVSIAPKPQIIFLHGDLGAGKTTLVQKLLQALGVKERVKSPTYTLIETYAVKNFKIYHLDLYRINRVEELEDLGIRDLTAEQAVLLIEWPEILAHTGMTPTLSCTLSLFNENARKIILSSSQEFWHEYLRTSTD